MLKPPSIMKGKKPATFKVNINRQNIQPHIYSIKYSGSLSIRAHSSRSGTQVTSFTSAALSHVKTISLIKLFYCNNQRHQCPLDFTLSCFVKQDVTQPFAGGGDQGREGDGEEEGTKTKDRETGKRGENALISVSIRSLLSGNLNMRNCPLATKMHGLLN